MPDENSLTRNSMSTSMWVVFGSQTGTAAGYAEELAEDLRRRNARLQGCVSMNEMNWESISRLPTIILAVIATAGDGEVPNNMEQGWKFLRKRSLSKNFFKNLQFAVFGVGDSAYVNFNASARRLDKRLSDLGALRIANVGLGNYQDLDSYETTWSNWTSTITAALSSKGPTKDPAFVSGELPYPAPLPDPSVVVENVSSHSTTAERATHWQPGNALVVGVNAKLRYGRLVRKQRLTSEALLGTDDPREVVHFEFHVPDVLYRPGDVVHIMPRNSKGAVEAFFELTGYDPDQVVELKSATSASNSIDLNVPVRCSLWELASVQLDLSCSPPRRFFERLSHFATDSMQKTKLLHLGSSGGAEERQQYVKYEKRTLLMVMRDFPSARPPLDYLLDIIPRLRARPFSIASSPTAHPQQIHICLSVVKYITSLRRLRHGVCSSFLQSVNLGDSVPLFVQPGSLSFPNPVDKYPMVLVGPGTGVAPFRSLLHERNAQGLNSAPAVLFFGCRSREHDLLYSDEWEELEKTGALTSIITAFSRETGEKQYVQHKIFEQRDDVVNILSAGSCYVAGSAGAMPRAVRESICLAISTVASCSTEEANSIVRKMVSLRRYCEESWS